MKSTPIAGVSPMTSLKCSFPELRLRQKQFGDREPHLDLSGKDVQVQSTLTRKLRNPLQRSKRKSMQRQITGAKAVCLLIAFIASISAQGGMIGITYSNTGDLTGDPVLNGTILTLDALATGSVISGNSSLNALLNPAVFHTHDFLDITTGLDNGTFVITFANGDILSGNLSEVDSDALLETNLGSFTQTLTFTGGTGRFVGASGSTSGGGVVGPDGFTTSGSGTLTAAGVSTPEPASGALIFAGLLVMIARRKPVRHRTARSHARRAVAFAEDPVLAETMNKSDRGTTEGATCGSA